MLSNIPLCFLCICYIDFFLKLSPVDAKDHKREKDRARWHAMSQDQRDEKNKRRRESYHNKKISIKLPKLPIKK